MIIFNINGKTASEVIIEKSIEAAILRLTEMQPSAKIKGIIEVVE
jgi:hypothetical protein